jgi:hypothetical protein
MSGWVVRAIDEESARSVMFAMFGLEENLLFAFINQCMLIRS